MSKYYEDIMFVKNKITAYLTEIFKVYGNELILRLEDYNLLSDKNNCIESSTAPGFIMEEFITSKLAIYTKDNNNVNEIKIEKIQERATVSMSYDCYVNYNDTLFMINIKVQKTGSNNNAVSAINILHRDYVKTHTEKKKSYIIVKTKYDYATATDKQRKIIIKGIETFNLEEIDFSLGHKQDYRNWSKVFNPVSGRLQINMKTRTACALPEDKISYALTKQFIDDIYNGKK